MRCPGFLIIIFLVFCFLTRISAYPQKQVTSKGIPLKFSLEDLEYRTFRYFWDLADSTSGLIPDRFPTA